MEVDGHKAPRREHPAEIKAHSGSDVVQEAPVRSRVTGIRDGVELPQVSGGSDVITVRGAAPVTSKLALLYLLHHSNIEVIAEV